MATETAPSAAAPPTSTASADIATRRHPFRARWVEDEARMRASYLATRRHLAPFLVPHRFEGKETIDPTTLRRAKYGYGIQLNRAYLQEIFGHLRGAPATYAWGAMSTDGAPITAAPKDGPARAFWLDATRGGKTLRNFVEQEVLEWMLSSLGGFIVLDIPSVKALSRADDQQLGKRPFAKFVPWGAVEDLGMGPTGLRWIKVCEGVDTREPDKDGAGVHHVLYRLTTAGATLVERFDKDGQRVGQPQDMGKLVDRQGNPRLPLVAAKVGEHPDLDYLGAGLLLGLDDIVIDLYNVTSEVREGYRDAAFGLLVHTGADPDNVAEKLADGSRLISLGDSATAKLERLAAESAEVATGLSLIELGVKNWALSAKRQAAEAMDGAPAQARSGVSLTAEFSLDLKPLLVAVTETLDAVESDMLFVAAQLAGLTPEQAGEVSVKRATEFRLEDEASRISRIVTEFVDSALPLPAEAKVLLAVKWLEGTGLLDLTATVKGDAGAGEAGGQTLRELLERQAREIADAEQTKAVNQASFTPPRVPGAPANGAPFLVPR